MGEEGKRSGTERSGRTHGCVHGLCRSGKVKPLIAVRALQCGCVPHAGALFAQLLHRTPETGPFPKPGSPPFPSLKALFLLLLLSSSSSKACVRVRMRRGARAATPGSSPLLVCLFSAGKSGRRRGGADGAA